ncbi:LuxR C-terminal-related transcriptional regulator [Virgibacillus pantothenticus]|nr:LuxR C-terminal-related transcriptional regulator [Virgibacillus pantothenticus]
MTNKEIALKLNYSIGIIEYFISNIFEKLSVRTRAGAVREAKAKEII